MTWRAVFGDRTIGRMLTLDAMRGGAALAVVTYHALGVAPRTALSGWQAWLPQIAAYSVHFAFAGIYLFFVISGFCIHLFWARARAAGIEKPVIDFFTFWKRRVRRLYPPYFAALAVYLCYAAYKTPVHVTGFYLWDVLLHLFMLHNVDLRTTYTINGAFYARDRRTTIPRLFPVAVPADSLRLDQDVAHNLLSPRCLVDPGSYVERIVWRSHSRD